jgi:hypothetical protein
MADHLIDSWAADTAPVVRLSTPGELAAAVPVLLGFRPRESLVMVALGGDRLRVGLVQRVDLADLRLDTAAVARLVRNVRSSAAAAVVAVVVTDAALDLAAGQRPGGDVADAVRGACAEAGVALVDLLAVCGDRWVSYLCDDPTCCPPEGTPVAAAGSTALEAAAVVAGQVIRPDRAAVLAQVAPVGYLALEAVEQALGRVAADPGATSTGEAAVRLVEAALAAPPEAGPRDVDLLARLLLAVAQPPVRDRLLGRCVGPAAEEAHALWLELTRRAPADLVAAPATLLAVSAYAAGDGLLARAALDRVLAADPEHVLARCLDALLQAAVAPGALRAALARGGWGAQCTQG